MTHPNLQTNGASLEDCHTNFFALTELSGIKWRKLVYSEIPPFPSSSATPNHPNTFSYHSNTPLSSSNTPNASTLDPILSSYARCLAADILCVWRRCSTPLTSPNVYDILPPPAPPPPMSLTAAKELWIFWYGEEPDLSEMLAPELLKQQTESDQGSWESGLSYECRSLLFKALHNLIERCLLSRDFIRLGKWFVQPYDDPLPPHTMGGCPPHGMGGTEGHLSFSFAFFVHGESSVCASIDVRQHPPVRRLSNVHLTHAQASHQGLKVILAPFGLAATLTGNRSQQETGNSRLLDDWNQFYPVSTLISGSNSPTSGVPTSGETLQTGNATPGSLALVETGKTTNLVVEVIVGGIKMRYPACYVFLTDMDAEWNLPVLTRTSTSGECNPQPENPLTSGECPENIDNSNGLTTKSSSLITPPPSPEENVEENTTFPMENLSDMCTIWGDFPEKLAPPSRKTSSLATLLAEQCWQEMLQPECKKKNVKKPTENDKLEENGNYVDPMAKTKCNCLTLNEEKTENLEEKNEKILETEEENLLPIEETEKKMEKLENVEVIEENVEKSIIVEEKVEIVEKPEKKNEKSIEKPLKTLKRPILLKKKTENFGENSDNWENFEENSLDLLYDYSTMMAWLNHPVKKLKKNQENSEKTDYFNFSSIPFGKKGKNLDLYSQYDLMNKMQKEKNEKIEKCGTKRAAGGDPYDFQDGNSSTGAASVGMEREESMEEDRDAPAEREEELREGFKVKVEPGQEEVPRMGGMDGMEGGLGDEPGDGEEEDGVGDGGGSNKGGTSVQEDGGGGGAAKKGASLFTSEGLQPSYKDLEQIFEHSDDTSSDEATQIQTPPDSNAPPPSNTPTTNSTTSATPTSTTHTTLATPTSTLPTLPHPTLNKYYDTLSSLSSLSSLSKMFPTPPSLENTLPSPSSQNPSTQSHSSQTAPSSPLSDDDSYVFLPSTIAPLIGSAKYSPLALLPPPPFPTFIPKSKFTTSNPNSSLTSLGASSLNVTSHNFGSRPMSMDFSMHVGRLMDFKTSDSEGNYGVHSQKSMDRSEDKDEEEEFNLERHDREETMDRDDLGEDREGVAILVNLLLGDVLDCNVFRDHNFDSCTLCVCNAGPKVVGNIRGSDFPFPSSPSSPSSHNNSPNSNPSHNLPYHSNHQDQSDSSSMSNLGNHVNNQGHYNNMVTNSNVNNSSHNTVNNSNNVEEPIRCSCGFSAIVNRRHAPNSGLFYEDSQEIIGIKNQKNQNNQEKNYKNQLKNEKHYENQENIDKNEEKSEKNHIVQYVIDSTFWITNSTNSPSIKKSKNQKITNFSNFSSLEYEDGNKITKIALLNVQNFNIKNEKNSKKIEKFEKNSENLMHKWSFLKTFGPGSNQQLVRVMKNLQPLLQTAILKKGQTRLWEPPSAVRGPLTWRQFHRLAGRGTDDRCEPQPIPTALVGHDAEWVCLSPYALQHWEALQLEPYSAPRDVVYLVVAPDNAFVLSKIKLFMKELSTAYETCRLGRHSPLGLRGQTDGILPIQMEMNKIELYAQLAGKALEANLQHVAIDKTLLEPPSELGPPGSISLASALDKPMASPVVQVPEVAILDPPPPVQAQPTDSSLPPSDLSSREDDPAELPAILIYFIDPYSFAKSDEPNEQKSSCLSILKSYDQVVNSLQDERMKNSLNLQIVAQDSVLELGKARHRRHRHVDHMRSLALSIFAQARRHLVHTNNIKSLTGFGTAAMAELFLKNKDEKQRAPYKLYSPPYILGPLRPKAENSETFGSQQVETSSILYLSYCLSEDQSFLLAVCTDEKGEIFESSVINIFIPNRTQRKKGLSAARRVGLAKLMDFVLQVISKSVKPWRLVVGRLGRIGHGEVKTWSFLLSRKNLLQVSKQLKDVCGQCGLMYPNQVPCIMSACLVSLEPDSTLRLMPDSFTPDERFSQISVNSTLSTPGDVTCTHILVFPTSATTQSSQTTFQEQNSIDPDEEFLLINDLNEDMNEHFNEDFNDIFNWTDQGPPSPRTSPIPAEINQYVSSSGLSQGQCEEIGTVLQQPLALGYLVSTAPTGRMPKWFWSSCPHLEGVCPAFLKNALHLHSPNILQSSEEFLPQSATASCHALDSQYTTDVLRYVLEGYNALSWLALDNNTRDRLSCLPVHIQVLAQLYHKTATLL